MEQTNQINQLPEKKSNSGLALQKHSRPLLAVIHEDYPKIKTVSDTKETDGLLNYLITMLNIKVSSESEAKDMQIQMLVVMDFIKSKFGNLTIPEIKEAFKMFVAREFPDIKVFRILDCVAIGEVLTAYRNFRNESLQVYSQKKQLQLQAPKEPTEDEKLKIRNGFLKMIYDELVKEGVCDDAWHLYDDLEQKLNLSNDHKKKLYSDQLEKYKVETFQYEQNRNPLAAARIISEINQKILKGQKFTVVQNRCKSIAVCQYLKDYLTDFDSFLNAITNE